MQVFSHVLEKTESDVVTAIEKSANKRGPLAGEFRKLITRKSSYVSLHYSKGKEPQVGWIKEMDKIALTNFIHNFDLKYLCVKTNYVESTRV